MIVLGIDGALSGFSAALAHDGSILAQRALEGPVALERGLPAIAGVLADAGIDRRALDRLAVSVGPGNFTGLRIAIAYAKSLAQGWNLPLAGVSSFDALEFGCGLQTVLTVIAGRAGVISARYRSGAQERRASGMVAGVLETVMTGVPPGTLAVIGAPEDVCDALAEAGFTVIPLAPLLTPPAAAVAIAGQHVQPAATAHDIRADYGEAAAARVPSFKTARRTR